MSCNIISSSDDAQLLCAVMCGGKSLRMGQDKGLIKRDDVTFAQKNFDKLISLGLPVVVSINPSQKDFYKEIFTEDHLVEDCMNLHGPLEGLLSVHNAYPKFDILILACDLPDISEKAIVQLISAYKDKSGEHDFFVYRHDDEYEPLLGIYTSEGLQKIFSLWLSGDLLKHSMKYVLEIGNTFSLLIAEEIKPGFKNYNTREDLN